MIEHQNICIFCRNEEEREEIHIHNVQSLLGSGYNESRPLVLLIHGVLSTHLTNSDVQLVKNGKKYKVFKANINLIVPMYGHFRYISRGTSYHYCNYF